MTDRPPDPEWPWIVAFALIGLGIVYVGLCALTYP